MIEWLDEMPEATVRRNEIPEHWISKGRHIENLEERLLRLLDDPCAPKREERIVLALRYCGSSRSIPSLLATMSKSDEKVQVQCAIKLGQLHAEEALPILERYLISGPPGLRANVAGAMGDIGGPAALASLQFALRKERFVVSSITQQITRLQVGATSRRSDVPVPEGLGP